MKRNSLADRFLFLTIILLTGCISTEGTLQIEGKVIDEYTNKLIPGRKIIVQGLVRRDEKILQVNAGQFSSDSSGSFRYLLEKVKDARYYKFSIAGDSDYTSKNIEEGLSELELNAKFQKFSLSKLVNISININRSSKSPLSDTLKLIWDSNGINGWNIYSYKVINNLKTGPSLDMELKWIGRIVNSTVQTRVFANKRTNLYWELYRNGKKYEFTDTITCKRDFANIVNFTY
jgi:hypothetical protein